MDIYEMAASGIIGETTPMIETSDDSEYIEDWSKDGRYIAYETSITNDLHILPLFGDRKAFPFMPTSSAQDEPHFSFDGKWLAYDSNESGSWEVYVASFPEADQKVQISTNGGVQPRWREDSKELYYLSLDGKMMAVDIKGGTRIERGIPRVLFGTGLDVVPLEDQYDVTHDGQRFLILNPVMETSLTPITVTLNWTSLLEK